jgi:uridylate kinase
MQGQVRDKKFKRILLKLSGEALTGKESFGIDPKILDLMALEIGQLVGIGVQVGLVVGGGNLFRGAALQEAGLDRVTGDHMGMLATVMNALAMRDATLFLLLIPQPVCGVLRLKPIWCLRPLKLMAFIRPIP